MNKKVVFIFISFALMINIYSQGNTKIEGYVLDSKTKEALKGANIFIKEANIGTISDSNGYFMFSNIEAGNYHLKFSFQGYNEYLLKINTEKVPILKLDIALDLNIKELLAVVIVGDDNNNYGFSRVVIMKNSLDQVSVSDIGDLLRAIPNLGAVRKGGANLDPVIRGFKFDQLNVQMDNGQSIEGGCPNRMDPTTSHIEASDIEAVEVFKGPFALRFGSVMGGVINLLTINPRPFDKFQIHVKGNIGFESNWNGQRQHLTVLGGGQKIFFTLTANNSLYGNYHDGDDNMVKSSFRKMGYNGKIGFSPAKGHIITLSYSEFYARDVAFPALPMDERADNTKLYSIDYKADNISKYFSSLSFKAYYSDVDHTMDNVQRSNSDSTVAIANILASKMGYRIETAINAIKGHLFVGSDFYKIDKDGNRDKYMIMQYPKADGTIPLKHEDLWNNATISNLGFFAEYKINMQNFDIIAAARYDYNQGKSDSISILNTSGQDLLATKADSTISQFSNISYSIGISKNINKNLSLGVSLGRGVRSPGMIERFIISLPVSFDNYEYIGNPQLKPETNNELDITLKYKKSNLGAFELTGFYSLITDYIGGVYIPKSIQKPLTATVLGVKSFDNLGNASLSGFEFGYQSPSDNNWRVTATSAYTLGTIKEVELLHFDNSGNATSSEIIKNDPIAEIPPLEAKVNFSYNFFNDKLIPQLGYRYVAAQNKISAANLEPSSPSFSLLNLSILYKYDKNLDIAAGVNNLMDITYAEHLNRRIVGTNYRIPEPGRIFFLNLIFNF